MFLNDCSKPTRKSMLGKHGQRNIVPGSKSRPTPKKEDTTVSDQIFSATRPRYQFGLPSSRPTSHLGLSASRLKSQLGRRVRNKNNSSVYEWKENNSENSSTVKEKVCNHNFQNNTKKSLFNSGYKENKRSENVQPTIKKCLFSKENEDPYFSKWNYETSAADVTGITDLPLFSASRPKSLMLERARKRSQDIKQNDNIGTTLMKMLTPHKTPKISHKEISYNERSGVTPHRFLQYYSLLKSPTPPPPPLYDSYLRKKLINIKHPEETLFPTSTSRSCNKRNLQMEKQNSSHLNKFGPPVNSTFIKESEGTDDSFVYNEMQSMIEDEMDVVKKKPNQLSVVTEEGITTTSIEQSMNDKCEADLTLCTDAMKQHCEQQNIIKDNVNDSVNVDDPSQGSVCNINLIQINIEQMANENIKLLAGFQREILNEYSIKLTERLNEIIKEQILLRNKTIQNELENVLRSNLCIYKNNIKKQYEECIKLLEPLKSGLDFETNIIQSTNKNKILNYMQTEAERMLEENEKLVENLQKDVVQDFQNQMTSMVNKNTHAQIDAISNAVKEDLDKIVLVKWDAVAQQMEFKKKQCLSYLEFMKNELKKEKVEQSQEFKEKFDHLQSDLNNFSNLNGELVNDYKKQISLEFQNKISMVSKKIIEQQVEDILNTFQTKQEKLNLFIPKLNSQSDKWLSFKNDITKSIESSNQNCSENSKIDDICTGITSLQLPVELKSPIKVESTTKTYSELRSQFKFCLKTPEVSRGMFKSVSLNQSCVLTPRSMSTMINDQVNQIFDS